MSELELQRLVDGQLSHLQRADLLQALETNSTKWRELALLLIEEQEWRKEIPLASQQTASAAPAHPDLALSAPEATVIRVAGRVQVNAALWKTLLGCCSLFFIGIYLGFLFRNLSATPANSHNFPALAGYGSDKVTTKSNNNALMYNSPWRVRVESNNSNPIEIPLVDAREIDPQWIMAGNSLELAKLNQQLKRKGYELEVKPTMYSGSLQDGRTIVVPVHDISVRPFGL